MSVLNYLDLATGHVSESTMDWLNKAPCVSPAMTIAPYEYGAFVSVPDAPLEHADLPEDLRDVLSFARDNGCVVVRLDADGDAVDGLPWFDW